MTVGRDILETLRIIGSDIVRAWIIAPSNENVLSGFCFETP